MAQPATLFPSPMVNSSPQVRLEIDHFPPLPEVAWKILELTSDLYMGVGQLSEVISRDQSLTGRVLRMANSAFFQRCREVKTVRHASTVLGNRRIRGIVIAASLGGILYKSANGRTLWEHALGVGLVSRELAGQCLRGIDLEEVFVAGLLHDVGKGLFDSQYPEQFVNAVQLASVQPQLSTCAAELLVMGMDHTEAGSLVASSWSLPDPLGQAIRFHHKPEQAENYMELCSVVNVADALCLRQGVGPLCREEIELESLPGTRMLDLDPGILDRLESSFIGQLREDKALFGIV